MKFLTDVVFIRVVDDVVYRNPVEHKKHENFPKHLYFQKKEEICLTSKIEMNRITSVGSEET